jgi:hypothetical protein
VPEGLLEDEPHVGRSGRLHAGSIGKRRSR